MERRIERIESTFTYSGPHTDTGERPSLNNPAAMQSDKTLDSNLPCALSMSSNASQDSSLNLSCSPGAFPASSLNKVLLTGQNVPVPNYLDLDIKALGSQQKLEKYFSFYRDELDPLIYHILAEDDTLATVQERSPILLVAICTAAAFCTGSSDYDVFIDVFIRAASAKLFSKSSTFDDVRALCIGAFWSCTVASALNALGKFLRPAVFQ